MEINQYNEQGMDNTRTCLQNLKSRGYGIVAMTLREGSIPLHELKVENKLALCFGSEVPGLTDTAHELADEYIKIPMQGFTQSFNLSVSAGISLYELMNRLRSLDVNWQLEENEKLDLYIDWLSRSTPTGRTLLNKLTDEFQVASE